MPPYLGARNNFPVNKCLYNEALGHHNLHEIVFFNYWNLCIDSGKENTSFHKL